MRYPYAEHLLGTVPGVCELPDSSQEQFRQILPGTGQKCANNPVNNAAGQMVMAGAWEHSESTVCFVGLAVATACARRWCPGGGSPWKCSVSSCTANHSNSIYLSFSHMWCMSWWISAMQDDFWLVVLRLRNLSVLSKFGKKPPSFEITQKTEKNEMPSSFYWMKENSTQRPGTAHLVQPICTTL